MENVAGEDRKQSSGPTEQDGEKVEGYSPEDFRSAANEGNSGKRERKSREFELGGTRSKRMKEESRLAKRKSKAAIEYAAVGPAA